jgi:hypothetical protein
MTAARHISLLLVSAFFLLPVFPQDAPPNTSKTTPWLTDEKAREVAGAAIHAVYPEPCYSTYRNENLESILLNLRKNPVVGNRLDNSVYFYRVASDVLQLRG